MNERDPKIVQSDLSRTVKQDGVTVEVSIIRLERETEWSLEVVNSPNLSGLWRRKGCGRSSAKAN
jgi:hypothetical protein